MPLPLYTAKSQTNCIKRSFFYFNASFIIDRFPWVSEKDKLHGVFTGPLTGRRLVTRTIGFVDVGNLGD